MIRHFADLRSPQIKQGAAAGWLLVLPVGQTEEHGPHLPVGTDTFITRRICEAAVERLADKPPACLLDPITYGFSQAVLESWPGTIVVGQSVLIDELSAIIGATVRMGFRKVAIVSGHGNHDGVIRVVARRVADERGIGPGVVFPYAFVSELIRSESSGGALGSCHAGEMETSLMQHLAPELVDMDSAPAGDRLTASPPFASSQAFVSTWTRQRSLSGAYGDPTPATAAFGERLFDLMVERTAAFFRYYHAAAQV